VSEARLKLTTYFGERQRTGDRFLADALFDLYARHAVGTSVLLRGVEGFGAKHHLRSDVVLTLSEDLPMVSVAVDVPGRIEAVLDEVHALERHGLVTLERARNGVGSVDGETKLTIYAGRQDRIGELVGLLRSHGLAGAIALLGVDGTVEGVRRRARFLTPNPDVPIMIVAVGAGHRIAAVLPELQRWPTTLERVRICKRDGEVLARPGQDAPLEKLMVYGAEHVDLVQRLRRAGARGVTCLRGIWGFYGDQEPHGDRLLQLRRRAPVVTVVVDTPEQIARSFDVIDEGLVTSEALPTA
jgi:PII-like signaling protein